MTPGTWYKAWILDIIRRKSGWTRCLVLRDIWRIRHEIWFAFVSEPVVRSPGTERLDGRGACKTRGHVQYMMWELDLLYKSGCSSDWLLDGIVSADNLRMNLPDTWYILVGYLGCIRLKCAGSALSTSLLIGR